MAELIKGMLLGGEARFVALDATDIVQKARETHGLSPLASAALGRAMSASVMIASDFKNENDHLSATIKSDGPAKSIVVAARQSGEVKGTIGDPYVDLPLNALGKLDVGAGVGKGTLTVLKDLGLKRPYLGTVELQSGEIGEDFAYYLMHSEQRPSIVYVGVLVDTDCSIRSASGLLVEPMPGCAQGALAALEQRAPEFARFNGIRARGKTFHQAIAQVFAGLNPVQLETRHPFYHCDCSEEHMQRALSALPQKDLMEMASEDGGAQIVCQFCHREYYFDANRLIRFANEQ